MFVKSRLPMGLTEHPTLVAVFCAASSHASAPAVL